MISKMTMSLSIKSHFGTATMAHTKNGVGASWRHLFLLVSCSHFAPKLYKSRKNALSHVFFTQNTKFVRRKASNFALIGPVDWHFAVSRQCSLSRSFRRIPYVCYGYTIHKSHT